MENKNGEGEMKVGSSISMVEGNLPPGFRFHPRDDELVCDYLFNRRLVIPTPHHPQPQPHLLLLDIDLNRCEPWDLPQRACVGGKEWYFYSQRDRKYATGLRTNRATATGYWKATGKDRAVHRKGTLVGMRKTLVFYKGRAPKGRKTEWVMHEFRLEGPSAPPPNNNIIDSPKEDWVLCRVFYKNREGFIRDNNMGSCSDETASASASATLPPLMDSYINFDQEPSSYLSDGHIINEQVPCFSIISNPSLPNLTSLVSEPKTPSKNPNPLFTTDQASTTTIMGLDSCSDQMVLRALLNQLTKIDGSISAKESQSFGEGSSQSLLTEVGIQTSAWNY